MVRRLASLRTFFYSCQLNIPNYWCPLNISNKLKSFTIYKDKPCINILLRSGGATSHQPRAQRSGALGIMTQTYQRSVRAKALKRDAIIKLLPLQGVTLETYALPRVPLRSALG